jgi:hypothetical protein
MENNIEEVATKYAKENSGNILYTGKDFFAALYAAFIAGYKYKNNEGQVPKTKKSVSSLW